MTSGTVSTYTALAKPLVQKNSILSLGKGNDTATISVIGGESAKGLLNSRLNSGKGSDILKFTVRAEGGYSYSNRSNYSNTYDDRSVGNYSSSSFQVGSYNYGYRNSIYTNSWSNNSNYDRDVTSASQYSNNSSQFTRNGSAIGVENSTLNTGAGKDTAIFEVFGGREAIGLRESSIRSGRGNDHLSFNVRAEGEDRHQNSYISSYSFDNDISRTWDSNYIYKNASTRSNGWYSYGSYSSKWSSQGKSREI